MVDEKPEHHGKSGSRKKPGGITPDVAKKQPVTLGQATYDPLKRTSTGWAPTRRKGKRETFRRARNSHAATRRKGVNVSKRNKKKNHREEKKEGAFLQQT